MRLPRPLTPGDLRERPDLAAYAALRACLEIARSMLLANLDDQHRLNACETCTGDAVLLHVDALLRVLERFTDVVYRDCDNDF